MKNSTAITILLVEDSDFAAARTCNMLADAGGPEFSPKIMRAARLEDGIRRLADTATDVVLLDLTLPDSNELDTFFRIHSRAPEVPVIVLSGLEDEALAIEALRNGAEDYLIKGSVTSHLLKRSILYAIERKQVQLELARYRERLEELVDVRTAELKEANQHLGEEVEARKSAQKALAQKVHQLECANFELERFVEIAAHDLQQPLRMVSLHTELLQRHCAGSSDPAAMELMDNILLGAKKLHTLMSGLMIYAEVGRSPDDLAPTDLETVLADAISGLHPLLAANQATVSHDPMPVVVADRLMMVRLFSNLVENAVRFRAEEAPRVHISAVRRNSTWVFSVRDNGIGIDPRYHHRIFRIFDKLDPADEGDRAGIGLAICRRIVEHHCGTIWVDSRPNEGSTFHFTLPVSMEAPCSSQQP